MTGMKIVLPPRTETTHDDMTLIDLLRPISATVLPRRAMITGSGEVMTEVEARAEAARRHRRPNTRRMAR